MEFVARGVPVHYVEHGEGLPVLARHGGEVDHRELLAWMRQPATTTATGKALASALPS